MHEPQRTPRNYTQSSQRRKFLSVLRENLCALCGKKHFCVNHNVATLYHVKMFRQALKNCAVFMFTAQPNCPQLIFTAVSQGAITCMGVWMTLQQGKMIFPLAQMTYSLGKMTHTLAPMVFPLTQMTYSLGKMTHTYAPMIFPLER